MPYIKEENRAPIKADFRQVRSSGDLNYAFTITILSVWKARPQYDTIHQLSRDFVIDPKNSPFMQSVRRELAAIFTVADIYTAAAMAFKEFYRRVGSKYEKAKIKENGDLPEYVEAIAALAAETEVTPQ